ncbi:MAG: hypothetical protein ACRD8W_00485 [Nitrososphaeraceae archaeon]
MPTGTDEIIIQIDRFTGLNINEAPNAIADTELADCINLDLAEGGELIKRTGFRTVHDDVVDGGADLTTIVQLLGFFLTSTVQQFVGSANGKLYTSPDSVTWTDQGAIAGVVHYGVQYVDRFYIVRTGSATGLLEWTGTTLTAITGSPDGTFCRVFKDRLFVLNSLSTTLSSRLYFSEPFDFSPTGWPATNFIDVGAGDGDWLVACWNIQDTLIVFKTGASWRLYVQGDPTLWILRSFNSEIGCISRHGLSVLENMLYFCGIKGAYITDGNTIRNISVQVSPVFEDVVVSTATINRTSSFIWDDKFVVSLETFPITPTWNEWSTVTWGSLLTTPWTGGNSKITYLVFHIRQKGWTTWSPIPGLAPHVFVSVLLSSTLKGVYSGDRVAVGKVYKYGEPRYSDDAASYGVTIETKEFDFGAATEMKRGKWMGINQRGDGFHLYTHITDGISRTPLISFTNSTPLELKFSGPGYFRSWRMQVLSASANPFTFFGITMHLHRRRYLAAHR